MSKHIAAFLALVTAALAAAPADAELFFDIGAHQSEVEASIALTQGPVKSTGTGAHLGLGVRRDVGEHGSIGARLELDDVDSDTLLAVRAFDYAYRISERFAVTAFAGAARLDLATPAYGYYLGAGLRVVDLAPRWDLGLELRHGEKLARDNLLPSDPQGGRVDNFYSITGFSLYLSRRF